MFLAHPLWNLVTEHLQSYFSPFLSWSHVIAAWYLWQYEQGIFFKWISAKGDRREKVKARIKHVVDKPGRIPLLFRLVLRRLVIIICLSQYVLLKYFQSCHYSPENQERFSLAGEDCIITPCSCFIGKCMRNHSSKALWPCFPGCSQAASLANKMKADALWNMGGWLHPQSSFGAPGRISGKSSTFFQKCLWKDGTDAMKPEVFQKHLPWMGRREQPRFPFQRAGARRLN